VTARFTTLVENQPSNVAVLEGTFAGAASVIALPLAGPSSPAVNCSGQLSHLTSLGHNFLLDGGCGVAASDTLSPADPLLGALANNGGTTLTRLPAANSPLRNLVLPLDCTSKDQRAVSRPKGKACEPGSVEVE